MGEVVEDALATVIPVTVTPGAIVVLPPRIDIPALAPGTWEGMILPPQCMEVSLALVDVKELVDV
jgi:hypothetical protein